MPGMRCSIAICSNSRINAKKSEKQVSFYRFPKDKELRQIWIQTCLRDGDWNPDSCRICSEHFSDEDYERNLQAELLNIPARKKLKATAVPFLKIIKEEDIVTPPTPELEESRHVDERNDTLLLNDFKSESDDEDYTVTMDCTVTAEDYKGTVEDYTMPAEDRVLSPTCSYSSSSQSPDENQYESLLKEYREIVKENEEFRKQMQLSNKIHEELKCKLKVLEKDLANLNSKFLIENSHCTQLENALKRFLSKAQRDIVIGRKRKVIWSTQDLTNAFAIRCISKRCYIYLREKLKYPLPALSSLQKWASKHNPSQHVLMDD